MSEAVETRINTDNPRPETLRRLRKLGVTSREIIDAYTLLEYEQAMTSTISFGNTNWLGYKTLQFPDDFFLKAELLWEFQPTLVIEVGTYMSGSALFMATTMDAYGVGKVLTIDINKFNRGFAVHPRIRYLQGRSSVDLKVLAEVKAEVEYRSPGNIMVILDSDHSADHVAKELRAYADFVSPGCYLIVEDSNLDGRPILQEEVGAGQIDGPGPWVAIEEWLPERPEFKVDERKASRYLRSMHSWIRRMKV